MSLIVQLGTTSVGYTPTLTSAVMSSSSNRNASFRSQSVSNNQPSNVAKHRLPMQINRQPQHINRTIVAQPHSSLPVRNIAALARPLSQSVTQPIKQPQVKPVVHNFHYQQQQQQQQKQKQQQQLQQHQKKQQNLHQNIQSISPSVAGRVLTSPVKDSTLDDDLLEGVVEKRPKYHKHIPLSYQYVLQDHNYGAPPPASPPPIPTPKPLLNGISLQNGIVRSQPHIVQQSPNYLQQHYNTNRTPITNIFGIGTRGPPPGDESDVDSSEGERDVDPQGEETETAPEGEGDDDNITRCVCEFQHDDGYMISCDRCLVWQHVDCMGIDRGNIPDEYLCEECQPRRIDKQRAIALQLRKRQELLDTSDTSSETSSSSDSHVPNNIPVRKQSGSVPNRRRSEPAQRKNSSSSNNNSVKQRRESAKEVHRPVQNSVRQNNRQTFRKKQVEKRPVRRKSTPLLALNMPEKVENEKKSLSPILSPDSSTSVQQLRQWIDSYEEAVTNHYSPELRARIASIKVNGIHSDLKLPTNLMSTPKCRVSLLPTGVKILVSSVSLPVNQPLLELRGKYMLCGSGPPNRPPRPSTPSPGPHIFHYQLPKDNTEVCVDARTYGNDARFVRRSCKSNTEIRHCVEKGTLHLYLVTTKPVDKNTEITLPHETPGVVPCACGGIVCSVLTSTSPIPAAREEHKIHNGTVSPLSNNISTPVSSANNNNNNNNNNNSNISNNNDQPMDKRRRGRRRTISETSNPQKQQPKPTPKNTAKVSPPAKTTVPKSPPIKASPIPQQPPPPPPPPPEPEPDPKPIEPQPSPEKSPSPPSPPPAPITRSSSIVNARKIQAPSSKKEISEPSTTTRAKRESSDKKKKMTREERKMEAIMKAFERMEKDQARKQEVQARQAQRKDSTELDVKPTQTTEPTEIKKVTIDKEEGFNANTKPPPRKRKFSTSRRKARGKTQNSYQTNLRPRRVLRNSNLRSQSPGSEKSSSDEEENTSPVIVHSTPPRASRTPSPPSTPLSQGVTTAAGLLMEFSNQSKYSRIEKSPPYDSAVNNQLNNSGHSTSSSDTPPTPMSKTCMLVAAAVGPLAAGFKFPKTKKGMLTSWFKSPENSPPMALCSPPTTADESPTRPGPGFAKKRWLRQAISEECDSPNSRPDMSVSPTDYVAPPKKRRLARESVSSSNSFTPPTTPTHNNDLSTQISYEDEDETVLSPPESKEKLENPIIDLEGSSQDSEDIETPLRGSQPHAEDTDHYIKPDNLNIKDEGDGVEDEEESDNYKAETKIKIKNEKTEHKISDGKDCDTISSPDSQSMTEQACAIKRKLSISEYRQRKQQGRNDDHLGEGDSDHVRPTSPATSATSSMSSSSSDEDEEETPAVPDVIAKSLLLEAALDTNLSKQAVPPLSRFNCAPTSVERQRENLTERLKREFGLFLSDDEEQEKIRKGTNPEPPALKDKETKKKLPPPPPPLEPPALHYPQLYYPTVGRPGVPIYTTHFPSGQVPGIPPPPPLIEPQYYTSTSTFYSQLPH